MEIGKLSIWINENRIEDIQKYALTLSGIEYESFIDELLHRLVTTSDNGSRNTIAIVLGDLHCDRAIEPLIELINNPNMSHCRGTFIYALENLNIADRLDDFIELLVTGNYEVKCMVYTLFEKQVSSMTESKKSMYIDMLKKRISETQESLELMYELCSNVFDVEV
ncbi:Uncharacterised protein [Eubacterium limosum]|uniref:HEAT repeat domain-containing protein n=1 Tax=Eubacterium limosum TaxID=1736 RepID=A0A6N3EW97_EUBLI